MKKVGVLLVIVLLTLVPPPVFAEIGQKAVNTGANLTMGWAECPKAWADESFSHKGFFRKVFGVFISGPVMCVVNVGARYGAAGADIITLPVNGNILKPAVHESDKPPLRLP